MIIRTKLQEVQNLIPQPNLVPTISIEKNFKKNPHNQVFYTKDEAIKYINKSNNNNLHLISEDKCADKGTKMYYTLDHELLYSFGCTKKYSLYECYERGDKVKLHLDIDIKNDDIPKNTDRLVYFDDIIKAALELMQVNLIKIFDKSEENSTKLKDPEIIILSSCRENKLSAHIIYNNIYFDDIYAIKYFMMSINSPLIKNKIIDPSIYRTGCLRLLWCSKLGKSNNLEFYKGINYNYGNNNKQLFMDTLIRNISKNNQLVPIIIQKDIQIKNKLRKIVNKETVIDNIITKNSSVSIEIIKKYLDILNKNRCDDYNNWVQIGMIIFNCQPNKEGFDLWNDWSSKSPNYNGRDICAYKWSTFKFSSLGIATLKFLARQDNAELYSQIECDIEKNNFESIKFTSNYLMDIDEKIKDKKSIVGKKVCEWMDKARETKTLAILSCYDTGKTSLIKKILNEFKKKTRRILFITYRQTLTNELHGNFKKLNVDSYLDGAFDSDRIICQIESLHKIANSEYAFDDEVPIPSYDLVIMDEIESILNHFESTTLREKEKTFNLMYDIIYNSKRVLALDGDFSNRSFEFINNIGDYKNEISKMSKYIILENEIKKNQRHFKFTYSRSEFDTKISDDLKSGKNIMIVSMSATIADYYHNLYQEKYKSTIHTSKTDDMLKDKLKDVNNMWIQYQLIISSPSIEAGVNFDREHIDRIYVVLSSDSTSARGLMQMLFRARKVKDSNIMVYLNSLPFCTEASFYKYEDVKEYVAEMFQNYLSKKVVVNEKTKKKGFKYEFNLYSKILVHNLVEKLNKESHYFVPYFIKLLKQKGHTFELLQNKRNNRKAINKGSILKEEIYNAPNIDINSFKEIMIKIKSNKATRDEKIMVDKYIFKKDWKVKEITKDFIELFYGKTNVLYNLRYLIDENQIGSCVDGNNILYFNKAEKLEQIKIVKEILTKLGYDNVHDKKQIDREQFDKNKNIVLKSCELFKNPTKYEHLFRFENKKINSVKRFLGLINTILKEFGVQIKNKQNSNSKEKINGKWKTKKENVYYINFIDSICDYI